jgi:hypothetical protein
MDYSRYREYKDKRQERRSADMGSGGMHVLELDQGRDFDSADIAVRNSDGSMGSRILLHATWQEDGSLRAQLELRFENQSMLVSAPEIGLADDGHQAGRSWVLVEMEQRQGFTEPMRFSINIPAPAGKAGADAGDTETAAAAVKSAREAIQAVRARCGDTKRCHYPLCDVATNGGMRKLADDRCITSMVPLEA